MKESYEGDVSVMTRESIFNIFTRFALQDLLKKLKIEFTNSWKKDKLVELLCEGDLKKL